MVVVIDLEEEEAKKTAEAAAAAAKQSPGSNGTTPKPESKTSDKKPSAAKLDGTKSASKPQPTSDTKAATASAKPEPKTETKTTESSSSKPQPKTETKTTESSSSKPQPKSETKTTETSSSKPQPKSETKTTESSSAESQPKSESKKTETSSAKSQSQSDAKSAEGKEGGKGSAKPSPSQKDVAAKPKTTAETKKPDKASGEGDGQKAEAKESPGVKDVPKQESKSADTKGAEISKPPETKTPAKKPKTGKGKTTDTTSSASGKKEQEKVTKSLKGDTTKSKSSEIGKEEKKAESKATKEVPSCCKKNMCIQTKESKDAKDTKKPKAESPAKADIEKEVKQRVQKEDDAPQESKASDLPVQGSEPKDVGEAELPKDKPEAPKEGAKEESTELPKEAGERPWQPSYADIISALNKPPTLQSWLKTVQDKLKKRNLEESVMAQFARCRTDEARMTLLYNLPMVHEVIKLKESYKGKNEEEAKALRLQGNTAFQKKEFDSALKLYSDSILKAPTESPELALAFANRSAVLYHKQLYVLCLQDIRQAFKYKYPDNLQYKLYERRGKSSFCLRLKEEAICSFQDSLNVLDKAQLEEKKLATVKSDLQKQLQKCSKLVQVENTKTAQDFNHNHGPIPIIKDKRSTHIPCMGTSLEMKSADAEGRGLYATRNIEVGEVLIVEKPYSSLTLADYNLTHCHHCCNRVICPLPCDQCSGVVFCSEECQVTALSSYHYAECKYHDLIQGCQLGMAPLALRMVLKAGFRYLRDYKEKSKEVPRDPLDIGCNENGVYNSQDYHTVYNLVAHSKERSSVDLFRRGLAAVFLLKCIEKSGFFSVGDDECVNLDEEKYYIGGHILRHCQMLPCNAHEVTEYVYKAFSVQMSEPEEVGSAIYSTLSLINHSCDPSVVRHSYGNACVVRAIRNISKGEEITDNYGVLYPVMTKKMRQEKLIAQYHFLCNCHACICNWPMYEKIRREFPVLKCKKCKIGRIMIPADNQTSRAMCEDCREVLDIHSDLLHLSKSEGFYQGCLDKILKGEERTEGLPYLVDHLRLLDRLLLRPWKDYNDCQEAIKQCYSILANCKIVEEPDSDDEELMEAEHRRPRANHHELKL